MNLIIDIGNSRSKVAIFSGEELMARYSFEELTVKKLSELLKEHPAVDHAILSSVAATDPLLPSYLRSLFPFVLEMSHQTPVPLQNDYLTPETLGLDRLAAAVGARVIFPDRDLLVIDTGTAVTFDLIRQEGTFAGGNISPGLHSRFRALHEFTRKLPLIDTVDQNPLIGRTTEEAIQAGVIQGMVLEIDGMIDLLKLAHPRLQPVLTGGDALFFERRLKNSIFVKFEITLIGLNRILEYNVEKQ